MALSYAAALVAVLSVAACSHGALVDHVDPLIGTGNAGFGIGSINPGAQVPFGAMRLGPDTSLGLDPFTIPFDHFGGYWHGDTHIRAFSHTHMVGSGVGDWGNFGVMPIRSVPTDADITNTHYHSRFAHEQEVARPGYYSVELEDPDTLAEVTVSGTMAGMHRYTCHGSGLCTILVDVCHGTSSGNACKVASVNVTAGSDGTVLMSGNVLNNGGLSGRGPLGGINVYFFASMAGLNASTALSTFGTWSNKTVKEQGTAVPPNGSGSVGAFATFKAASSSAVVTVRMGISFISEKHAAANLATQQGNATFDATRAAASTTWETMLQRVQVHDSAASSDDLTKLYSAVYRTFLSPTTYSEADGSYFGFDGKVHGWPNASTGSRFLSDMSIWDIHRSQAPWLVVAAPEIARDTALSLLTMASEGGRLPRWPLASIYTGCMIGSHGVVILGDMVGKRVEGVDAQAVYKVMRTTIEAQDVEHNYSTLGWVPSEATGQAVSHTLANAFDDGVTAQVAALLNHTDDAAVFRARSTNFQNVFNKTDLFMYNRFGNGTWDPPISPLFIYPFEKAYTEGDAWQWVWFVPHNVSGLVSLFPSPEVYVDRLNMLFVKSLEWKLGTTLPNDYYWAGNEPDLLAPWQFAAYGSPDAGRFIHLTQNWTRWELDAKYPVSPGGVPGNDDYGTMSAHATFGLLGLYPLSGMQVYVLGSPTFANVTIAVPASAGLTRTPPTLNIVATGTSAVNKYVAKATLNGKALHTPFVHHHDLFGQPHNVLEFTMTDKPVTWAAGPASPPPYMPNP